MRRVVVASSNRGKLAEFRELFAHLPIDLVSQDSLGIAPADETATTFVENALLKARQAARHSGMPAIADDSGLIVDALDGAPGLYSARYAGAGASDDANIDKLLDELARRPEAPRTARFYSLVVYLRHADDPAPLICEGTWAGEILAERRGTRGFGYDPVFFDAARGLAAGELDTEFKNLISHRGQALAQLKARLFAP